MAFNDDEYVLNENWILFVVESKTDTELVLKPYIEFVWEEGESEVRSFATPIGKPRTLLDYVELT